MADITPTQKDKRTGANPSLSRTILDEDSAESHQQNKFKPSGTMTKCLTLRHFGAFPQVDLTCGLVASWRPTPLYRYERRAISRDQTRTRYLHL